MSYMTSTVNMSCLGIALIMEAMVDKRPGSNKPGYDRNRIYFCAVRGA